MINIYYPIYINLESELLDLTYNIHIDDNQLGVYSSKISDLILRAAIEIESISKELYYSVVEKETNNIRFDDAIKHLNKLWLLDKKKIIISSVSCFQTEKVLSPFIKDEPKTNGKMTYSWNNSYQNLKHDRAKSIKYGNIKYLFDILGALYILNIYYKNQTFSLKQGYTDADLPYTLDSKLFSIKIHQWSTYDDTANYVKKSDFDECIYLTKWTDESLENHIRGNQLMKEKKIELFLKHPKANNPDKVDTSKGTGDPIFEILGYDEYWKLNRIALKEYDKVAKNINYEAIINKNSI